jgi:Flp pilus assembly protein TadD
MKPIVHGFAILAIAALTAGSSRIAAEVRQAPTAGAAANAELLYQQAKTQFDNLDYENAVRQLDLAISALLAIAPRDTTTRERLASAYEMRGRSKFGLGNPDEAKADFVSLLRVDANHQLTGQVSPRVVTLFEETVAQTVTTLQLAVLPATARVTVDDIPVTTTGPVRVTLGDHIVAAEQRGYTSAKQTITAAAGAPATATLTLERISAVINVLTSPAEVEVLMDGKSLGKTAPGPAAPEFGEAISKSGIPAPTVSAALVIGDVTPGTHAFEFVRPCTVRMSTKLAVEKPDDYTLGPVALQPAVASLTVQTPEPGAQVFVDGAQKGTTPYSVSDLCEGPHQVELRSRFGRDTRRIDARTGDKITFDGVLKPTFAVVSASGELANLDVDMRISVERALQGASSVRLIAPPADQTDKLLKGNQLAPSWLAVDAEGKPTGAAMQMNRPVRGEASTKISDALGTQGVASVSVLDRNRLMVTLLASGIGSPDVVEIRLDRPDSIASAIDKLDRAIALSRSSLGFLAIDVASLSGPVVAGVDANGPANGKVQAGDLIVSAGGQPVPDVAALDKIVASGKPGDTLALEVRDPKGAPKKADVAIFLTPRLIGMSDQSVLANRALVDLRSRAASTTDPFLLSVIRLNTAVALARLGECAAARDELKQVQLPDQPGVGPGTVQYLLGVCSEELGNRAEADAAFKAAAATESLLTEDGPAVKDLVAARASGVK